MLNCDFDDFAPKQTRSFEENLWLYVIEDCYNRAMCGSKAALAWFYDSEQFELLCTELGWNAVAIRERILPKDFVEWIEAERSKAVVVRTDKADERPVKLSYYMRRKANLEAALQMPIPGQQKPLAAPAVAPVHLSVPTFQIALAAGQDKWESELADLMERRSLDEWEAFAERCEIESIINLQQQMEQPA